MWRQLGAQFTDLFAVVLIVASGIAFLAYGLEDPRDIGTFQLAVAILGVVVLNAAIGFAQEYSAERTAQALAAMVPHTCRVLRGGERLEVPARELVPGDVVVLEAGDAVSADCRVVEAHELAVNNAPLTGESNAVGRTADPVAAPTAVTLISLADALGTTATALRGGGVDLPPGQGHALLHPQLPDLGPEECRAPLSTHGAELRARPGGGTGRSLRGRPRGRGHEPGLERARHRPRPGRYGADAARRPAERAHTEPWAGGAREMWVSIQPTRIVRIQKEWA